MPRCPDCDHLLSTAEINIAQGMALCPKCDTMTSISDLSMTERSLEEIISNPPASCQLSQEVDSIRLTASTKSTTGFLATLAFALFWNGITMMFVSVAIAGLYFNLIGPVPDWFPALGIENGKPIMNDKPMGLGITLFLCLFLTPFVAIGTAMIYAALMYLCGKVEVVISEFDSWTATGVGALKWKTRFDSQSIERVRESVASRSEDGKPTYHIELGQSQNSVKFGTMLGDDQREWMRAMLTVLLTNEEFRKTFSHLL